MKYVLITGASSGIGKELAKKIAMQGYGLILVARRENLLLDLKNEIEEKFGSDVHVLTKDITLNTKEVYDYCKDNNLDVEILVNNAGYGLYGKFDEQDLGRTLGMIDLNVRSLVELTYYFIEDMKKNKKGHILNVGSVASFEPGPYMAVYYATKSFVLNFSLALREELKDDGIKVSVLCPAPTKTEFFDVANASTSTVANLFSRSAENAADTAMKILKDNKAYLIDGPAYKLSIPIARIIKPTLSSKIIGLVQGTMKKSK